jgi:hypothetical protein
MVNLLSGCLSVQQKSGRASGRYYAWVGVAAHALSTYRPGPTLGTIGRARIALSSVVPHVAHQAWPIWNV